MEWLHGRKLEISIGIHCGTASSVRSESDEVDARLLRPIELPGKTGQFVLYRVLHT